MTAQTAMLLAIGVLDCAPPCNYAESGQKELPASQVRIVARVSATIIAAERVQVPRAGARPPSTPTASLGARPRVIWVTHARRDGGISVDFQ